MRRAHVIAVAAVAALAVVVVGGAWAYDHSSEDTIAPGVKVGGVDVGGLTAAQAQARLERQLLDPLREPIVIRRGTRSWRLGSKEAQHRRGHRRAASTPRCSAAATAASSRARGAR